MCKCCGCGGEKTYKCEKCGQTSGVPKDCCGQPMKKQ